MLVRLFVWFFALLATEEIVSRQEPSVLTEAIHFTRTGTVYFVCRCPRCGGNARQHMRNGSNDAPAWQCVVRR